MLVAQTMVAAAIAASGDFSKFTEDSRLDFDRAIPAECPCENKTLCNPITVQHEKEVFGFLKKGAGNDTYLNLDWSQVTTVAWTTDPQLVCLAHSHNVRVVGSTPRFGLGLGSNATALAAWTASLTEQIQGNFLDGVVFDYEYPVMLEDDNLRTEYNTIVNATTVALHTAIPGSQTSVCVPFVPNHDNRYYDFKTLSEVSDLFYIMFYDTRTQIMEQCIAAPNAAYQLAISSINQYTYLGVNKSKIILGLPWYGKDYKCLPGTGEKDEFCKIPWEGPGWRGVSCSAIHNTVEVHFSDVMLMLPNSTTGRQWNNYTQTPYFNYVAADGSVHQLWYDDAESLQAKYELVRKTMIRGTGPFQFLDLDYSTPLAKQQAQSMWDALKVFTGK
eukprot:TRINITY_DN1336_c1_g1_i1.p1 TRINITY_DN1336_c1_g1~~TRINITY_DN1336_c1_g1_i1.p1  ORF type:complete len:405 (+),score=93.68 TRINITY_DN1336_c1_g1_i1:57-1217(+)